MFDYTFLKRVLMLYSLYLDVLLFSSSGDELDLNVRRKWAVSQLSSLITHPSMSSDRTWSPRLMEFLFHSAFFVVKVPMTAIANVMTES